MNLFLSRPYVRALLVLVAAVMIAGGLMSFNTANSQGPGGPGECCTNFCGLEPPCPGPGDFDCAMFGQVGTWPFCTDPVEPPPPSCADFGQLGTWPNCYNPPPPPPEPDPTCADFGQLGTWPNCYNPPPPPDPTCADFGLLGTWPNCYAPTPTCADLGLLGTWPNCYAPPDPPTCQDLDISLWGDYPPNCYFPTCQQLGNCPVDPDPTCADSGQLGTYPNCYDDPGGDPQPIVTLTANPNPASSNTALTWNSTYADSCAGVGASFTTGGEPDGTDGTVTPGFTYQVQCIGPGGNAIAQVTVGLTGAGACGDPDSLEATANPNRVRADMDTPIEITWTGSDLDAAECSLTNMNTGLEVGDGSTVTDCDTSGSETIASGVSAQTTYRVQCGLFKKDVIVNIVPSYEEF